MKKMSVLKGLLDLPPKELRPDIRFSWVKRLACPTLSVKEKNDTYIYYLMACTLFKFFFFLSLLFIGGYILNQFSVFDIFFFQNIYLTIGMFTDVSVFVLLVCLLPFYLVKFISNVRIKGYNVLWFSPIGPGWKNKKKTVIALCVYWLCVYAFILNCIDSLPLFPVFNFFASGGVFSLVFYLVLVSYFLTVTSVFSAISIVVLWSFVSGIKKQF